MFPIRDHNPSERTPYVTYVLLALNILVYLAMLPLSDDALWRVYGDWAMIPARISAGDGYYTLVTSMFMHAGFMHILGNMLFLYIFGDNLEDQMGHVTFLAFYLLGGFGADLAHLAGDPGSMVPTVGASGAIAAVLGGYLLMFPRARVDVLVFIVFFVKVFSLPAWVMLGLWFGVQLVSGAADSAGSGGVAYWAHVGGFVVGIILTIPLWLRRGGMSYWGRTDGHPPHPENQLRVVASRLPKVRRR